MAHLGGHNIWGGGQQYNTIFSVWTFRGNCRVEDIFRIVLSCYFTFTVLISALMVLKQWKINLLLPENRGTKLYQWSLYSSPCTCTKNKGEKMVNLKKKCFWAKMLLNYIKYRPMSTCLNIVWLKRRVSMNHFCILSYGDCLGKSPVAS